jgi:hypothetical protein
MSVDHVYKKITIVLIVCYFLIFITATLFYPLTENLNYIGQFKEGFLFLVLIGPIYGFFANGVFWGVKQLLFSVLTVVILLSGNIIPIIIIYKSRKLFPFIVVSIMFFCIYLFLGLILFGVRKGDVL